MAGVKCKVCASPHRAAVDEALVADASSHRGIARQYGLPEDSVQRHKKHLAVALTEAHKLQRRESDINALHAFQRIYTRLNLALDACDEQLWDAEQQRYRFEPGAMESLIKSADSLRKCIESASRFLAFLQEQQDRERREEEEAADLRAMLARGLVADDLVAALEGFVANGAAAAAAEHILGPGGYRERVARRMEGES